MKSSPWHFYYLAALMGISSLLAYDVNFFDLALMFAKAANLITIAGLVVACVDLYGCYKTGHKCNVSENNKNEVKK